MTTANKKSRVIIPALRSFSLRSPASVSCLVDCQGFNLALCPEEITAGQSGRWFQIAVTIEHHDQTLSGGPQVGCYLAGGFVGHVLRSFVEIVIVR